MRYDRTRSISNREKTLLQHYKKKTLPTYYHQNKSYGVATKNNYKYFTLVNKPHKSIDVQQKNKQQVQKHTTHMYNEHQAFDVHT